MIFLSDAQILERPRIERNKRNRDNRFKSAQLFDKVWTIAPTAEKLLSSHDTIRKHILEYRESQKKLKHHTYLYVKDIIVCVQSTRSAAYLVPIGNANEQQQPGWWTEHEKLKPADETICLLGWNSPNTLRSPLMTGSKMV